jgi:hypothetical protein
MSKKSQREAREMKEEKEQRARSRFLTTLKGYLSTFALLYRQDISDEAVGAYEVALRHLSPSELQLGCQEATRRCKFFPNPAEILDSLKAAREKIPFGTYAVPTDTETMTQKERNAIGAQIRAVGQKLSMPKKAREVGEEG